MKLTHKLYTADEPSVVPCAYCGRTVGLLHIGDNEESGDLWYGFVSCDECWNTEIEVPAPINDPV